MTTMTTRKDEYNLSAETVIVAVINYDGDDKLFDWAAYAGKRYTDVAAHGDKIAKDLAAVCFPYLPIEKWRD